MFQLRDGLLLSLYPATEHAKDAGVDRAVVDGHGSSIGHPVRSREQVDDVISAAVDAGGRIVGTVGDRPWGIYSGYCTDPDGHLWEVVHFSADQLWTGAAGCEPVRLGLASSSGELNRSCGRLLLRGRRAP